MSAPPPAPEAEEFRRHARAFADWMADYMAGVGDLPVRSRDLPGAVMERLAGGPPEEGEPVEDIFRDFRDAVLPGITHWQHPRFFGYFPANNSPPSVLAEMLTAALGAQCMLWETSPAGTEMETLVLEWLRRMTGLPEGFEGAIQDSASSATLVALLVARERASGGRANREGLHGAGPFAAYASAEAHSSVEKGAMVAGFGLEGLRRIPVDGAFAMRPDALEAAIRRDRAEGRVPACVVATLGTTGVGGVDPLAEIGEICAREGAYLHVDAAWAGSALLLEEHRDMIRGVERADSFVFNPHKWLFTNFDCSAHYVRSAEELERTLSVFPEYLRTEAGDRVTDYRNRSIPLGRRFRALKLWFVIRNYGVEGLRRLIRGHIAMAGDLERRIAADPDFELMAPRSLALLNFRLRPAGAGDGEDLDGLNAELLRRVNESGIAYLSPGRVGGRHSIRFAIGQRATTPEDVERAWREVRRIGGELAGA